MKAFALLACASLLACSNSTPPPPTPVLTPTPVAKPVVVEPTPASLPVADVAPKQVDKPQAKAADKPNPKKDLPAPPTPQPKPSAPMPTAPPTPGPAKPEPSKPDNHAEGPVKFMDEGSKVDHEHSLDDMMGDSKAAAQKVKDKKK